VSALIEAGAEVTFHITDRYRAMVETTGAHVVRYPAVCEQLGLGERRDLRAHVRDVASVSAAIAPSLVASGRRADLVVFDASAFWGRIVARERGIPSASSVTTFVFTRSMLQLIGRSTWMTDADIDVLVTAGDLTLAYTSQLFQPAGAFLDDTHLFVGPLLATRRRDGLRVGPIGSRPLAYVSLGTIYNDNLALLQRIATQLSAAGWQVVVSLGADDAHATGAWSAHVRAYPFVDQLAMLAEAKLVVCHGGLQTVTEALALGVPCIVIPQDVDQHVVGQRAAGLGAAVMLDEKTLTDEAFVGALARIEAERSRFETAAAAIGRSFADAMPLATAVQRLLALPSTRTRTR